MTWLFLIIMAILIAIPLTRKWMWTGVKAVYSIVAILIQLLWVPSKKGKKAPSMIKIAGDEYSTLDPRLMISFVTLGIIAGVALVISVIDWWFALAFFWAAAGTFILSGLKNIPEDPPHRALLTVLGTRRAVKIGEGWRFFPFYPFVTGSVLIKVEAINIDLDQTGSGRHNTPVIRSPDWVEIAIPTHLTITPDDSAEGLLRWENNGGEEGVSNILIDITRQELRSWAVKEDANHKTWEDVIRADDVASRRLIQAILGEDVDENEAKEIQRGHGNCKHKKLGFRFNRLNIGDMKILGETAIAAEKMAKEERDREAEKVEMAHAIDMIKKVAAETGLSIEEAKELFQTERSKVVKTIDERRLNISDETRKALKEIAPLLKGIFVAKE